MGYEQILKENKERMCTLFTYEQSDIALKKDGY